MKLLRIIGPALLALGVLAASSASAVAEGILALPLTGTGEGGTSTLETTNKEKTSCTKTSILEIKFTTDQKGTATIHLTGCKAEGLVPENTLGDESGVILSKVNFLVCLVEPKTLVFGVLIEPVATEHIEVPAIGALILLKGAVIAKSDSANRGKAFLFLLKGKAGLQSEATECEINGQKFKHTYELALDSQAKDFPASAEAHFTITLNAEAEFEDK